MANVSWRRLVQQRLLEKRRILVSDVIRDSSLLDGFPYRYIFVAVGRRMRLEELFVAVESLEARGWVPVSWQLVAEIRGVIMRGRPAPPPPESPRPPPVPTADPAE